MAKRKAPELNPPPVMTLKCGDNTHEIYALEEHQSMDCVGSRSLKFHGQSVGYGEGPMTSPDRHTAGPWEFKQERSTKYIVSTANPSGIFLGTYIAHVEPATTVRNSYLGPETKEEEWANGLLLASAPDLLAAARAAIKHLETIIPLIVVVAFSEPPERRSV